MKINIRKILNLVLVIILLCSFVACNKEIISVLNINFSPEIYVGEEIEIDVDSSVDGDIITYENLNPEIIELKDNKVKALKKGIAEVIISSSYKTSETISIIVLDAVAPTSIEFSIIGENFITEVPYKYEINVLPGNASKEFIFNYSFSSLTLDQNNNEIVFHRAGFHTITCFSKKDRNVSFSISVEVNFNPEVEVYQLLFVGNSLTKYQHDIPKLVSEMMSEKGIKVNYTLDGPSAQWIIDHKNTFDKLIANNKYTHVILQEKSYGTISEYNKFESSVLEFSEKIEENGAKIYLYQTWAYTSGWGNLSKKEMYEGIRDAYHLVASKVNGTVIKAGDAFFEYEKLYGDSISLYYDTHHPSKYGAFLSACVHYSTLTGNKASELEYVYSDIELTYANQLKLVADKVVFGE